MQFHEKKISRKDLVIKKHTSIYENIGTAVGSLYFFFESELTTRNQIPYFGFIM